MIFSLLAKVMGKKSKFEIAVIDKVKELRIKKNFTQDDVAMFLNTSRGFIGQIESPNSNSKYNLDHLNKLAQEMGCSPKDFFPDKPVIEAGKAKKKS
jgi:transcriptional regulator with XRE-family HTH domain